VVAVDPVEEDVLAVLGLYVELDVVADVSVEELAAAVDPVEVVVAEFGLYEVLDVVVVAELGLYVELEVVAAVLEVVAAVLEVVAAVLEVVAAVVPVEDVLAAFGLYVEVDVVVAALGLNAELAVVAEVVDAVDAELCLANKFGLKPLLVELFRVTVPTVVVVPEVLVPVTLAC